MPCNAVIQVKSKMSLNASDILTSDYYIDLFAENMSEICGFSVQAWRANNGKFYARKGAAATIWIEFYDDEVIDRTQRLTSMAAETVALALRKVAYTKALDTVFMSVDRITSSEVHWDDSGVELQVEFA